VHPQNFECIDVVPRAVAHNIGYLAQSFLVNALQATLAAAIVRNPATARYTNWSSRAN
jgi:hypothetical protein